MKRPTTWKPGRTNNWTVKIVHPPQNILNYRADFFPRSFHYKIDAMQLLSEVEVNGGVTKLVDERKGRPK